MEITLTEADAHKIASIVASEVVQQLKTAGFTPQHSAPVGAVAAEQIATNGKKIGAPDARR